MTVENISTSTFTNVFKSNKRAGLAQGSETSRKLFKTRNRPVVDSVNGDVLSSNPLDERISSIKQANANEIEYVSSRDSVEKLLEDNENFPAEFYLNSDLIPVEGVPFEDKKPSIAENDSTSSRSLPQLIDIDMANGLYQVTFN